MTRARGYAAISVDAEVPVSFDAPGDIDALVDVSRTHGVPLTWLVYTSRDRPDTVARYYHDHVIGRLPGSHELGLHVHFDDPRLEHYQPDPAERRQAIVAGAEVLRAYGITPTSFRAGCWCVQASDVAVLEEVGIRVDSSVCPGFRSPNHPGHGDWRGLTFRDPYRPAYDSLLQQGEARLLVVPVSSSAEPGPDGDRACAYLEYRGWDGLKPILDWYVTAGKPMSIGTHDGRVRGSGHPSPGEVLGQAVPYLKARGVEFVTLTRMGELYGHGDAD